MLKYGSRVFDSGNLVRRSRPRLRFSIVCLAPSRFVGRTGAKHDGRSIQRFSFSAHQVTNMFLRVWVVAWGSTASDRHRDAAVRTGQFVVASHWCSAALTQLVGSQASSATSASVATDSPWRRGSRTWPELLHGAAGSWALFLQSPDHPV